MGVGEEDNSELFYRHLRDPGKPSSDLAKFAQSEPKVSRAVTSAGQVDVGDIKGALEDLWEAGNILFLVLGVEGWDYMDSHFVAAHHVL